jgi:serine/threonine protein kinase
MHMTLEDIFLAAVEKAPADRTAYLDAACGADAKLRAQVEALVRSHDEAGSMLEQPLFRPGPTVDETAVVDRPGTVIGPYKLLEPIGEGGMGTVWMAQQTQPVKRLVAVKLIKAGMDSKQVIARFEAERQALALMDHPNIARVLDAGTTGSGRPYFVMDLVKGMPITRYCDEHRLTPRQRLELFMPVCQAVQHAHQKGIIHRDLKPSNILVAPFDGKPVVKVIDFGVAKAAGQQLTDHTLVTGFGAVVGTLEYMSPEQAELNNQDIDTRSDIYALGVLLYELLAGSPPFSRKELEKAGMVEMLRLIREQEPSKPSTKLSTAEGLPTLAANRGTEPVKLTKLVRGELDWIVMKALEKDRNRRYETANGFAMDVQRYLADEPVLACPPSASYRLRKFARKHRTALTTAAAFVVLLAAGAAVAILLAVRATEAETLALAANGQLDAANQNLKTINTDLDLARQAADKSAAAEKQAADNERRASALARTRLKEIEKANALLESIFLDLNPLFAAKGGPPLSEQLTKRLLAIADQLDAEAIGDPLTAARLQNFLGNTLLGLGKSGKAIELYRRAWQTRAKLLGRDHKDTLISMGNVAGGYRAIGKPELALPLYEEALKLTKAKFGPNHHETLVSTDNLAGLYRAIGKPDLALPLFEETLKIRKAELGPYDPLTLLSMNNLADGYRDARMLDRALPLYEETLKLMKAKLGPNHLFTLYCMNDLALAYQDAGKLDLALPLFEEAFKVTKTRLGPDYSDTLGMMGNLAKAYLDHKQTEKAIALVEELVIRQRKRLGAETRPFAGLLAKVGLALLEARQFSHAEKLLHECLAIREKHDAELWTTFHTQSILGAALQGQKKYAAAEPLLLKGYQGMKAREKAIPLQGATRIPEALDRLIELYTATNRPDEAKKWRAERAKYPEAKKASQLLERKEKK